jgi:hypothetical protein
MKRSKVFAGLIITLILIVTIVSCGKDNEGQLPTVNTIEIKNVNFSSAIVIGEVTNEGEGGVTQKGVVFSNVANPTIDGNFTDHGPGSGQFESAINGLSPNTMYYVRAYAVNTAGVEYGVEKTFKTLSK